MLGITLKWTFSGSIIILRQMHDCPISHPVSKNISFWYRTLTFSKYNSTHFLSSPVRTKGWSIFQQPCANISWIESFLVPFWYQDFLTPYLSWCSFLVGPLPAGLVICFRVSIAFYTIHRKLNPSCNFEHRLSSRLFSGNPRGSGVRPRSRGLEKAAGVDHMSRDPALVPVAVAHQRWTPPPAAQPLWGGEEGRSIRNCSSNLLGRTSWFFLRIFSCKNKIRGFSISRQSVKQAIKQKQKQQSNRKWSPLV